MNRLGVLDPEALPYFQVLETISTEDILLERMKRLKEIWIEHDPPIGAAYDVEKLEFDPIKINQEANTYFELMLRDRVNQAARAVTLAYATDGDLDTIASRYPGGVPRAEGEDDEHYRRRIWLSPATLSPHGLEEAYVFWALSGDPTLKDASATTKEGTGQVNVTILPSGNDPVPTAEQLLGVRAYIHDHARKGLTDIVSVLPPRIIYTRYVIDVWVYPGPDAVQIMRNLREGLQNLINDQYWLGFDHTRMAIATVCGKVTGVQNVHILEPTRSLDADLRSVVKVREIVLNLKGRKE